MMMFTSAKLSVMEYQPKKHEIPFYSQHETGWYFCEEGCSRPLAELDFVEFRRPYFVFKVRFLTEDKLVTDSIYAPLRLDPTKIQRRFFFRNRKSTEEIEAKDFVTSRTGDAVSL